MRRLPALRSLNAMLACSLWLVLAGLTTSACRAQQAAAKDYWYQGAAEITSYDLEQARYGEIRQGNAVMIFVTEDFSASKQVKLDAPQRAGDDAVKVLKLNLTKNFNTGIYPYSMMMSVFTPVSPERPETLKVTTSSQEWCGHTFTQLNATESGYRARQLSYFESDGDLDLTLPPVVLEDALWTMVRLRPGDLPTGELEVLPGTFYQRTRHLPWRAEKARATLGPAKGEDGLMAYRLEFPDLRRSLEIRFEEAFPHRIESWEEIAPGGFGPGAKMLTTRGVRKERMMVDYWTKNRTIDAPLRQQLGLD